MMVCRYDDRRLVLILQIDHSRVAGLIAAHWGNEEFARPRPYASMVIAAQEHDSGWWDWEIKPTLTEQGRPIDYIGSAARLGEVWLDFYRHGIERVAARDPYAAYNVSMHGDGLLTQGMGLLPYMPDQSTKPDVKAFLDEQKAFRANLVTELKELEQYRDFADEESLWTNFKYMEVFDQLGQFICNRYPLNSTERQNGPSRTLSNVPVPVAPGKDDVTIEVAVQDESRAVVRPYPFDVDPLVISYQGRLVPNRVYAGQDDFLPHFYTGERVTITYSLHSK